MLKYQQKQTVIDAIKETIEGARSIILVDYRGLSVEEDTKLRKALREEKVTYKVFKNSMMKFAFKETEFEALNDDLAGPSAIAISYEDPTAGARVILKQSKSLKKLSFKSGVVEGTYYDETTIVKIAAIPSRDELLAKLLGSFKSPISAFARTMKALAEKVEEEGVDTVAGLVTESTEKVVEEVVTEEVETVVEETVVEETKEEVTE